MDLSCVNTIFLVKNPVYAIRYRYIGIEKSMPDYLTALGDKLRRARKRRFPHDDLAAFALRIGVSRSTLQKMEKGDLSVTTGKYYRTAEILGLEDTFGGLLHLEESLFDDPRSP